MKRASLLPLLATNFCGVANDNFLKTLASFTVLGWVVDERVRIVLIGVTAAALVLPYILVSPLADRLTCLFSKQHIVRYAKYAEIPIVALAIVGFIAHSIPLVVTSVVLMGLQSALFSPAKYALIRDIGGESRISEGMGLMEGVSLLGVLGGTILASFLSDIDNPCFGFIVLIALAFAGYLCSMSIQAKEELNHEFHAIYPIRFFCRARRIVNRVLGLGDIIAALCIFWATAAMLQQGLLIYGTQVLRVGATKTGLLLIIAAISIVTGQVLAGFIDQKRPLIAYVPFFGFASAAILALLFIAPLSFSAFSVLLALLAFSLGFFKLPLDAAIQRCVKGPRLNTILAYFNQISFLYMFGASVVYAFLGWFLGPRAFLAFLVLAMCFISLYFLTGNREAMFCFGTALFFPRYHIHASPLPQGKTILVLPNHPALIDPLLLLTAYRRTHLRPLVDAAFFKDPIFGRVLRTLNAIPVPDLRQRHTSQDVTQAFNLHPLVIEALSNGENILLYPSGHIYTEDCENLGTRQLAYTVCRDLPPGVVVVGIRTHGLWGSIWSRKGRKSSPSFILTLLRAAFLYPISLFRLPRIVLIHAEDLTSRVGFWSEEPRLAFNRHLADWYNDRHPDLS